jgi:hypothetical protein
MAGFPAAIGVCAIILFGLAVSGCARSGGNSLPNGGCQPGVCVGSTPDSTPESMGYLVP